jgi:ribosomal protein L24E
VIANARPLIVLVALHLSPCWASDGFDYVKDSDTLIYGGSYFSQRTQNPNDARTLYAEKMSTHARTVLYRGQGVLSEIQATPGGNLVGVVERQWEENVTKDRATYVDRRVDKSGRLLEVFYFEDSKLVVLNLDGTIIDTIDGVRRYAWDPTGGRIAFATGTYREGEVGFEPTGVWIYDVASKRSERIYSGGVDIQWAAWDGCVYIYDPSSPNAHVVRFDPTTREVAATSHKGIHFSPGGGYYYVQSDGSKLSVFRTKDDGQIQVDLSIPRDQARIVSGAAGWLGDSTLIVPSPVPSDDSDYLYDVEKGTVRYAAGKVMPADSRGDRVLVVQGISVTERHVQDFSTP